MIADRTADLLDQVSEVQRDREMLAEAIRMAMSDAPGLVQLTPAQHRAFDRAFGRTNGGSKVTQVCPVCGAANGADKEHSCGTTDSSGALDRAKGGAA